MTNIWILKKKLKGIGKELQRLKKKKGFKNIRYIEKLEYSRENIKRKVNSLKQMKGGKNV